MEFDVLGWPRDEPAVSLDHRTFSYAGKFVMTNTGKAVVREADSVIAAASFNEDRTDTTTIWLRYLTVHADHRGRGIGARLARQCREEFELAGYERTKIGVNNPYSFEALSKAGFGYTGNTTGIAELILSTGIPTPSRYREGLQEFAGRTELSDAERKFISRRLERGPPEIVDPIE